MCVINVRSLILSDIHIFPITGAWKSRTLFTARFLSHSTKPSPPGTPPSPRRYYRATCFSGVLDDWRCIKKAYIEIVAGWVTCGYFPFVAKNSNHQTLWYIGWSLGGKSTTPRPDSRGIQGLKSQETNEHRADRGVNKHTLKGRYLASVHTKALSPRQCFFDAHKQSRAKWLGNNHISNECLGQFSEAIHTHQPAFDKHFGGVNTYFICATNCCFIRP